MDALLAKAGRDALVVVDQKDNIGSLVVRMRRAKGEDVGHKAGLAMKKARDMWTATTKTDRMDAEVPRRPRIVQNVPPEALTTL